MTVPTSPANRPTSTFARPDCPEWCISDHRNEMDLITHEATAITPGISVMRTDCPDEGRIGKPVLYVHVEREIATWEDAGRLAHAILDGVDYLNGADQD
jgi:hypothetical protein